MLADTFDSFDESTLGNFQESTLGARTGIAGQLFGGGTYTFRGDTAVSLKRISRFDPAVPEWNQIGVGLSSGSITDAIDFNGNLVICGSFTHILSGQNAVNIMSIDSDETFSALGKGFNSICLGVNVINGKLYACGFFTFNSDFSTSLKRIAVYDPDTDTWSQVGSGADGTVTRLRNRAAGGVYAVGDFNTIDGVSADSIATFDGTTFSQFSADALTIAIEDVAEVDGETVIGGRWVSLLGDGDINDVAIFSGGSWKKMNTGFDGGSTVFVLGVHNAELYAGGDFQLDGSTSKTLRRFAKWDGSTWEEVDGSFQTGGSQVFAITTFNDNLHVSGRLQTAGGSALAINHVTALESGSWAKLATGFDPSNSNCRALLVTEVFD